MHTRGLESERSVNLEAIELKNVCAFLWVQILPYPQLWVPVEQYKYTWQKHDSIPRPYWKKKFMDYNVLYTFQY